MKTEWFGVEAHEWVYMNGCNLRRSLHHVLRSSEKHQPQEALHSQMNNWDQSNDVSLYVSLTLPIPTQWTHEWYDHGCSHEANSTYFTKSDPPGSSIKYQIWILDRDHCSKRQSGHLLRVDHISPLTSKREQCFIRIDSHYSHRLMFFALNISASNTIWGLRNWMADTGSCIMSYLIGDPFYKKEA
jgi:hypothetical protein